MRTAKARPSGVLRITSVLDSVPMVADWIAEYHGRYPEVQIDFQPTDRRVDLIAERFDLGLRIGLMRDSSLRAVQLGELEIWIVAGAGYLRRRGTPRTPRELAEHEWIALSVIPAPWACTFTSPRGRSETVRLRGAISVATASAMHCLVRADIGIGALPSSTVHADVAAGRLRRLLPRYRLPKACLYAAYPGQLAPPAKTRAFIDLAKELIAGGRGEQPRRQA